MGERATGSDRDRGLVVAVALSAALVAAVFRVWRKRAPLSRDGRAKRRRDGDRDGDGPNPQRGQDTGPG